MSNWSEKVYKYPAPAPGMTGIVTLPQGAQILHVGIQDNHVYFWARVNPGNQHEDVEFTTLGTGWPVNPEAKHCGTVISPAGYVWHLFRS